MAFGNFSVQWEGTSPHSRSWAGVYLHVPRRDHSKSNSNGQKLSAGLGGGWPRLKGQKPWTTDDLSTWRMGRNIKIGHGVGNWD